MAILEVCEGDITQLKVDAIVNAANSQLAGGSGWGNSQGRRFGSVTGGMPYVGPVWQGGGYNEDILLASCYQACISLAEKAWL